MAYMRFEGFYLAHGITHTPLEKFVEGRKYWVQRVSEMTTWTSCTQDCFYCSVSSMDSFSIDLDYVMVLRQN